MGNSSVGELLLIAVSQPVAGGFFVLVIAFCFCVMLAKLAPSESKTKDGREDIEKREMMTRTNMRIYI